MKKSLILMCMGGMLALCAPLAASDAAIDPPVVKHITTEKSRLPENNYTPASNEHSLVSKEAAVGNADPAPARHGGGVVVISGSALLLIIILLILLV